MDGVLLLTVRKPKPIPDLVVEASKGYSADYNINNPGGFADKYLNSKSSPNLKKVLDRVNKDSTLVSAINTVVDRCMENGWLVRGIDKRSKEKAAISKLRELRFDRTLWQSLYHFVLYRNAFLEIEMAGDEVVGLHVLEPTLMRIQADQHGEVTGYWQDVPTRKGDKKPSWTPEEVLHIKSSTFTTAVWGDVDIATLDRLLDMKEALKNFLLWLFATNQFRGFFSVEEGANDQQITDFMAHLKTLQYDVNRPVVTRGKINYQLLRDFKDGEVFIKLWYKIDEDILNLLQVPPIFSGSPEGSNRSNSDTQGVAFNTTIKSIQRRYAESVTNDLLPMMSFEKMEFAFEPVDRKSQKDIMEVALNFKNIGATSEAIQEFLRSEGFDYGEKMLYTPEEIAAQGMAGKANLTGSDKGFPSRQGKGENTANKKIGTGSEATTRQDQLVSQAEQTKKRYGEYW